MFYRELNRLGSHCSHRIFVHCTDYRTCMETQFDCERESNLEAKDMMQEYDESLES